MAVDERQRVQNRRWFSTFRPKSPIFENKLEPFSENDSRDDPDCTGKPCRPLFVSHRRSLSSVFKTVKARYSRDKLEKNETEGPIPSSALPPWTPPSKVLVQNSNQTTPSLSHDSPPRLEFPSDCSSRDSTSGPSTFRAGLEKAVADINDKYGTVSNTRLPDNMPDIGRSRSARANSLPFHARSTFRPRYQLPTFVNPPASTAQSTVAELRGFSPTISTECVSLDASSRVLPELHLDAVLGPCFDLMGLIESRPATNCNSSPETLSPTQESSVALASSKSSTLTVLREADKEDHNEAACDPDTQFCELAFDGPSCSASMADPCHANNLCKHVKMHADQRSRSRSSSGKLPSTPARSKPSSFDHENELAETDTELTRIRANSTPENPEVIPEKLFSSRQPSASSHASVSANERVSSVSELVIKFRRMGSLPGTFPATTPSESLQFHRVMRKTSRETQFEGYRSRFSNNSEDNSALFSNPGEMVDDRQQVVIPGAVFDTQLDS